MNDQKEMTYRKLFNIHYNNKTFTIFIDEYGRRTFLEVDSSGKYIYPLLDDFIQLHKIYNERDIFTLHDGPFYELGEHLPIHKPKKVIFQEYVRETTGNIAYALAVLILTNSIIGTVTGRKLTLVQDHEKITIVAEYIDGALIENTKDLDNTLGYKTVSTEDVIRAINQNDKIGAEYKKYAIELATFIKNKYPDTDSRIFYENMKNCIVNVENEDQMGKYLAGEYSVDINKISLREDYRNSAETIIHEFAHAYHHWKENTIYKPKFRTEQAGSSLDEAMTNKIISGLIPTHTYIRNGKVLDYFLSCVDYSYYDYEREGITKLISLLKEKYKEVDIDYIINSVDAMNDTYFSTGEEIKLEEASETLEQLFNICICNIDLNSNSVYQPFIDFLKLIDYNHYENVAEKYLKRYNDILLQKDYNQTKVNPNIQKFINEIEFFKCTKSGFEGICSALDINTISQEDPYKPLKTFAASPIKYISEEELKNFFCDILDIYNDFLYRNGYTRTDTITSEEMKTRMKQFEGITIVGYTVTNDDILHPIIDVKNNTLFYNKETEIPTLDEQGRIALIEKANTVTEKIIDGNDFQYGFIRGLFDSLDKPSIQLDDNFWQHAFKLEAYQYKRLDLYLDGSKVAEEYLNDLSVVVGKAEDGTNTFTLRAADQTIYRENVGSNPVIVPMKQYIYEYLKSNKDATSIELRELLNKDYVKRLLSSDDPHSPINYSSAFYDLLRFNSNMVNDTDKAQDIYYIVLEDENEKIGLDQIKLQLEPNEINISIGEDYQNVEKYIRGDDETSAIIPFETVLDYYGILQEDKSDYHFIKQEIIDLYGYYVQDVYINKDSKDNGKENRIMHNK